MLFLIGFIFSVQIMVILVDEFYFHYRREIPRWERIGHPLDTLTVLACYGYALSFEYSPQTVGPFIGMALFSTIFVTKDEFVHAKYCDPGEHWLHAVLFAFHPLVLLAIAALWTGVSARNPLGLPTVVAGVPLKIMLIAQCLLTGVFGIYQTVYWNWICRNRPA
ncbi:MAG TPA: hypothetical protein PKZ53_14810 [Acidobacteriota bacterium]|nr:hypothetical protein [Acidobacteriota bacterium]HNJ41763.1 hypothetical protein [Acidobacteriota bacterium]